MTRRAGAPAEPDLLAIHRELRCAASIGELLTRACALACTSCGFTRSVILTVRGDYLTADGIDSLDEPASDLLRRSVLVNPIPLRGWNEESALLRGEANVRGAARSVVAEALQLNHFALGVLAPEESAPLGILVADRPAGEVDDAAQSAIAGFAGITAIAIEQAVVKARMQELFDELRFLSGSILGLASEMQETPVSIPSHGRHGPVFSGLGDAASRGPVSRTGLGLTPREHDIAQQLARGLSNRAIADVLHLSTDTVKGNVARVLRKLEAANRAEAVAKYLSARVDAGR